MGEKTSFEAWGRNARDPRTERFSAWSWELQGKGLHSGKLQKCIQAPRQTKGQGAGRNVSSKHLPNPENLHQL